MSRITKQGIATALLGCGLGIATLPALAQDAASQSPQSSASQQEFDKVFLRHASEGGLAEVQFGQLAQQIGVPIPGRANSTAQAPSR